MSSCRSCEKIRLIDADDLIEAAEVNCEDRSFLRKLIDYIEDAEQIKVDEDIVTIMRRLGE